MVASSRFNTMRPRNLRHTDPLPREGVAGISPPVLLRMRRVLLCLLLLGTPAAMQAQFTYTTNNGSITITGYTGTGGDVVIPSAINGLPVTSIGEDAFENKINLTGITIPGSITNIGVYAFYECSGLTNVTIPDSVTTIGADAFRDCTGLPSVTIPSSVTSIGGDALQDCTYLISVYFIGNAPTAPALFEFDSATVYYLPGTTGWSNTFSRLPAVLWNPLIQASGTSFGVSNSQFGFNVTGTTNIPIVVEACSNLASPVWTPLQSLTLTNGLFHFSEPVQTNGSGRFYRISSP